MPDGTVTTGKKLTVGSWYMVQPTQLSPLENQELGTVDSDTVFNIPVEVAHENDPRLRA